MSNRAMDLLREWYFRTREANFRSCYPQIAVRWEKCGLAWQSVGVGFELSRCTSPRELHAWEEAGHQFCKIPEIQQALIVGNNFHGWTVTQLRHAAKISRPKCLALMRVGLRRYYELCLDAGIIDSEDVMQNYLSGLKQIAQYFGVSPKTIRRWVVDAGLPVRRVDGGSVLASKEEMDDWFLEKCEYAHSKRED